MQTMVRSSSSSNQPSFPYGSLLRTSAYPHIGVVTQVHYRVPDALQKNKN